MKYIQYNSMFNVYRFGSFKKMAQIPGMMGGSVLEFNFRIFLLEFLGKH